MPYFFEKYQLMVFKHSFKTKIAIRLTELYSQTSIMDYVLKFIIESHIDKTRILRGTIIARHA
jgi:hypothetical protein